MVLDYRTVSTVHAKLIYKNGEFFVQDTHSSNGTMVYLQGPLPLVNNQIVRLRMGRSTLALQVPPTLASDFLILSLRRNGQYLLLFVELYNVLHSQLLAQLLCLISSTSCPSRHPTSLAPFVKLIKQILIQSLLLFLQQQWWHPRVPLKGSGSLMSTRGSTAFRTKPCRMCPMHKSEQRVMQQQHLLPLLVVVEMRKVVRVQDNLHEEDLRISWTWNPSPPPLHPLLQFLFLLVPSNSPPRLCLSTC
jgi:hypothetical protein